MLPSTSTTSNPSLQSMPAPVPTLRPGQDQGIPLQKDTPPLERSISTSVVQGIYIIGCVRNVVLFFPSFLLFFHRFGNYLVILSTVTLRNVVLVAFLVIAERHSYPRSV